MGAVGVAPGAGPQALLRTALARRGPATT